MSYGSLLAADVNGSVHNPRKRYVDVFIDEQTKFVLVDEHTLA